MRSTGNRYRLFIIGGILAAVLLSVRYLLPLALPFLVGLAVAFAYKVGLFNIGASGQYTIGAFLALKSEAKRS